MTQNNHLNYRTLSNSQVLLHPNPKGVIQFIGSFIFGSFPIWAYKYLHQFLFDQGYSLILYRFPLNPFQFNHWGVSLGLLKEQHTLKAKIVEVLKKDNQPSDVIEKYSKQDNYLWLGHSLGCKYIILLEILTNEPTRRREILYECLDKSNADKLVKKIDLMVSSNQVFIRDQPSVLLAPEISNTVRFLKSGWRVSNPWTSPNQKETECLIRSSTDLFNLTGVISFNWDSIAEDDVAFLVEQLKDKYFQPSLYQELKGYHFEPLGIHIENLGHVIAYLLRELKHRQLTGRIEPRKTQRN
jgi:Protein of unknown function (DUF1350)